jgi:iron complex outermembrane receptor protein
LILSDDAQRAGLRLLALAASLLLVSAASAQEPGAEASPGETETPSSEAGDSPEAEEAAGSAETDEIEAPERAAPDYQALLEETEEPDPGVYFGIEEIKVTSQRRMATLEDVPVSATIFSASDIESAGMGDIRDISAYTPNLEIKTSFAASNPTLFIRGVGLNDYNANAASAVAIYQDDVYMNSPAGQLFQLFDVEGVEVLRGPQGSLYGRNASAGAIRVLSRKPTNDLEGSLFVGYGRWYELEVEGAAGGPIVDDVLTSRVAARLHRRDGFVDNGCGGLPASAPPAVCGGGTVNEPEILDDLPEEVNDIYNWAARTLLRLTPQGSDTDWLLNLHGGQNLSQAAQLHHVGTKPRYGRSDESGYPNSASLQEKNAADPYRGDYNKVGDEKLDVAGTSLTGHMRFGALELTSISAYEWNDRFVEDNTDANPNRMIEADFDDSAWQFSEDLRLSSDTGGNLSWVLGTYYLMEQLRVDNFWAQRNRFTDQVIDQDLWTVAGYAHAAWIFLDDFILEGGVRYNWERKDFSIFSKSRLGNFELGQLNDSTVKTWSAPTGDLSLSYHLSDDATVYAKYSRGWKGGHFNGGAFTASANQDVTEQILEPVEPETVDSWEAGLKSFWFDRRLMFNLTGFYYRYKNLQVFNLENQQGSVPVQLLINANDAEVYGLELELTARPVPGLDIRVQGGWLESQYLDFTRTFFRFVSSPGGGVFTVPLTADFTGNRLISSPKYTLAMIAKYEIPLGRWGALTPQYDVTYKSETFFDATEGTGLPRREGQEPLPEFALGQKGYWLHNVRLAYRPWEDGRIEFAGWVRNLTNRAYKIDAFDVTEAYSLILEVWGEPRTFGGSVTLAF